MFLKISQYSQENTCAGASRPSTLLRRDCNTGVLLWICEYFPFFKNTYFEKHLRTVVYDSNYMLHKKLNKIIQEPDWLFVSFWNIKSLCFTYSHLFSFALSLAVIRCHSFSFFLLVAIRCHSSSFVVTRSHS